MRTTHRVVADDDYMKEAQRLSISQVAALRLIYQTPLIWWSCRAILVAAIIFMIEIDYARGTRDNLQTVTIQVRDHEVRSDRPRSQRADVLEALLQHIDRESSHGDLAQPTGLVGGRTTL